MRRACHKFSNQCRFAPLVSIPYNHPRARAPQAVSNASLAGPNVALNGIYTGLVLAHGQTIAVALAFSPSNAGSFGWQHGACKRRRQFSRDNLLDSHNPERKSFAIDSSSGPGLGCQWVGRSKQL
jgi:hypothetical protein